MQTRTLSYMFGLISNASPRQRHPTRNTAIRPTPDIPTPIKFLSAR